MKWILLQALLTLALVARCGAAPPQSPLVEESLRKARQAPKPPVEPPPSLKLVQTIPLPGVEGRMDHFAHDGAGQRLFLSALGSNTLEVIDLKAGGVQSFAGFLQPQGVAFVPALNRVVVANGQGGQCDFLDGTTLKRISNTPLADDADNIRFDEAAGRIYVGYGYGAIAAIDPASGRILGEAKLSGHPQSFQLETKGNRIFVNIPSQREVAVVDRTSLAVTAKWKPEGVTANFPMALDEEHRRVFIGCRAPSILLVLDMDTGAKVSKIYIAGDVDDLFYDPVPQLIYASCGEGYVSIVKEWDANRFNPVAKIPTAKGARTSFFMPESRRLAVAVPKSAEQAVAEVRIYQLLP